MLGVTRAMLEVLGEQGIKLKFLYMKDLCCNSLSYLLDPGIVVSGKSGYLCFLPCMGMSRGPLSPPDLMSFTVATEMPVVPLHHFQ